MNTISRRKNNWIDPDIYDEYFREEDEVADPKNVILRSLADRRVHSCSKPELLKQLCSRRVKRNQLQKALTDLIDAGIVEQQADDVVALKVFTGVIQATKSGGGFLICDQDVDDFYVPENEMQYVLPEDRVEAVAFGTDERDRYMAKMLNVVYRKHSTIVGTFKKRKYDSVVKPEDARIPMQIVVKPGDENSAETGQIVVVEIAEKGLLKQGVSGRVTEILGVRNDKGIEIDIAVHKFNLPYKFSEETIEEVSKFYDHVTKRDLKNRVDLRDIPFVTIDGADAKDFDDAVYCEPMPDGQGYRLLVAIADVSHYVKVGSAVDKDAQERTTSVYFPTKVIPMLPEELSNGLCSLNPHVDRCTLVCDAVVDNKGKVQAYQFYPAVICSAARLIYDNVWEALSQPESAAALAMQEVLPHVRDLYELYKILQKSREIRGAMDFETVETYVVADEQGKISKILPRTRNDAHRLIEEMMLVANTSAADFLERNKAPCLYRVHEPPSEDRLIKVRATLGTYGLTLGGADSPQPSDYCAVLEKIKDRSDRAALQVILLRSMQQAMYSPYNLGHFGLAYPAYTHFTSPIRRYPDLLVHRSIRAILSGKKYSPKLLVEAQAPDERRKPSVPKEQAAQKKSAHMEVWEKLGVICSNNERRADEASYDVMAWLKCYYMQQYIGQKFSGTVTGVAPFAVFVTLDDYFVEGSVHVSELDDYFVYDEKRNVLQGTYGNKCYKLGMKVLVQVVRCDLDNRRIELRMTSAETKRPKAKQGAKKPMPAKRSGRSRRRRDDDNLVF